ncbi:hypothetical protein WJX79_000593 [Trebouxia sp. C0005]
MLWPELRRSAGLPQPPRAAAAHRRAASRHRALQSIAQSQPAYVLESWPWFVRHVSATRKRWLRWHVQDEDETQGKRAASYGLLAGIQNNELL